MTCNNQPSNHSCGSSSGNDNPFLLHLPGGRRGNDDCDDDQRGRTGGRLGGHQETAMNNSVFGIIDLVLELISEHDFPPCVDNEDNAGDDERRIDNQNPGDPNVARQ
jgi:hypothetical protein